jgi:hypothetical protein
MGLNIGLYLRRSEVLVRKSEVLVRKSEVLVWTSDQEGTKGICLCKQETHVEDSPRALVKSSTKVSIKASVRALPTVNGARSA